MMLAYEHWCVDAQCLVMLLLLPLLELLSSPHFFVPLPSSTWNFVEAPRCFQ